LERKMVEIPELRVSELALLRAINDRCRDRRRCWVSESISEGRPSLVDYLRILGLVKVRVRSGSRCSVTVTWFGTHTLNYYSREEQLNVAHMDRGQVCRVLNKVGVPYTHSDSTEELREKLTSSLERGGPALTPLEKLYAKRAAKSAVRAGTGRGASKKVPDEPETPTKAVSRAGLAGVLSDAKTLPEAVSLIVDFYYGGWDGGAASEPCISVGVLLAELCYVEPFSARLTYLPYPKRWRKVRAACERMRGGGRLGERYAQSPITGEVCRCYTPYPDIDEEE